MARFHFDSHIPHRLAAELRRRGHVAATASDLGLIDAVDPLHLLRAAEQNAILLTHDSGFRPLHEAWVVWTQAWGKPPHAGIIWLDTFLDLGNPLREIDGSLQRGWEPGGNLWRYSERHGWKRFIAKRDWRGWAASPLELA